MTSLEMSDEEIEVGSVQHVNASTVMSLKPVNSNDTKFSAKDEHSIQNGISVDVAHAKFKVWLISFSDAVTVIVRPKWYFDNLTLYKNKADSVLPWLNELSMNASSEIGMTIKFQCNVLSNFATMRPSLQRDVHYFRRSVLLNYQELDCRDFFEVLGWSDIAKHKHLFEKAVTLPNWEFSETHITHSHLVWETAMLFMLTTSRKINEFYSILNQVLEFCKRNTLYQPNDFASVVTYLDPMSIADISILARNDHSVMDAVVVEHVFSPLLISHDGAVISVLRSNFQPNLTIPMVDALKNSKVVHVTCTTNVYLENGRIRTGIKKFITTLNPFIALHMSRHLDSRHELVLKLDKLFSWYRRSGNYNVNMYEVGI